MKKHQDAEAASSARLLLRRDDVATIRESTGLNRSDVAIAIGVTPSTVWRWERGTRIPRSPAAANYARLLRRMGASW